MGILETESVQLIESGIELFQLKPGDRLGVRVADDVSIDMVEEIGRVLKNHWPQFDPVVFHGGIEIFIVRKDD